MNKRLILTICLGLMLSGLNAGTQSLPKGRAQLNAGVGLSGWGVPVYLGFDYAASDVITIGVEFSHRSFRENWKSVYYRHNITGFSGNFNYHFGPLLKIPNKWDVYAGLNLGFYMWSSPYLYPGNYNSGLGLGAQIGGRYFLNNKVGLNLEFGGGNAFSNGKFGLTIRF